MKEYRTCKPEKGGINMRKGEFHKVIKADGHKSPTKKKKKKTGKISLAIKQPRGPK